MTPDGKGVSVRDLKQGVGAIVEIRRRSAKTYFTVGAASEFSGMHPQVIEAFVRGRVIPSAARGDRGAPLLDEHGMARLREIQRLRTCGRTSLRTIRYVADLLDRLESAERRIEAVRDLLG